jgi:hypothetical protein
VDLEAQLIAEAWAAVSGDEPARQTPRPGPVELTGGSGELASRFAVQETAVACIGAALMAAACLHLQRDGSVPDLRLDRGHAAAAVRSERYFRRGEESAGTSFAPLSRFWRTCDGWVRTHANYPWHKAALLSSLGTADRVEAVAAAMGDVSAEEVEDRVFGAGGVAAAVRSLDGWRAHPQGRAVAAEALVGHQIAGDAPCRVPPSGELPAAGVRVLDLTRVIAGPVCTRYFAALGAEVLRLDPRGHPDMRRGAVADTLLGKRSAVLDLASPGGFDTLHRLLDEADVVACGYRPGALDRFGLTPAALAERHPGVVAVFLSAWGHSGPWASRRGFDSVVQAPAGIALGESLDGTEPGALPCQLLDHGTGYLAAAAALDGLRRQRDHGGTHVRHLSLARTAWWLTSTSARRSAADPAASPPASSEWLTELDGVNGPITAVAPAGVLSGAALRWPAPATGYGNDAPDWPPPPQKPRML